MASERISIDATRNSVRSVYPTPTLPNGRYRRYSQHFTDRHGWPTCPFSALYDWKKAQMFTWLARKSGSSAIARELYGAVVTQARSPAFYRDFGVTDTAEGRYELVALHLVLVLERLGQPDVNDEPLRRALLETFVTDMDDAMREMGVGDMSVGRRVKKAAGGIYTRAAVYGAGLAAGSDEALKAAVTDFLYEGRGGGRDGGQLARAVAYVRAAAAVLAARPAGELTAGRATFPAIDGAEHGVTENAP